MRSLALGPLPEPAAIELLLASGLSDEQARHINRVARGHPLLLQVAAAAATERPWLDLEDAAVPEAIDAVTRLFLADLDAATRRAVDAGSVVRRVTQPLLAAMLPDVAPHDAAARLAALPFVHATREGLAIHETIQEVAARALQATDPVAHQRYRRSAWRELRRDLGGAGGPEVWRFTADMLYLVGNPVVREAFFPSTERTHIVEPARAEDAPQLAAIAATHEPPGTAALLAAWWSRLPQAFRVARSADGTVEGFACMFERRQARRSWLHADPIATAWWRHLRDDPVGRRDEVLFLPRWLTVEAGELPSDAQAALWLDIKGAYTARRPLLRRLYTVVRDLARWAPVVGPLGFAPVPGDPVVVDGERYHPVVLDFGPDSVDGWFARLAAAELGLEDGIVLHHEAHTIEVDGNQIPLSPLEFAVARCLIERDGRVATHEDLRREAWRTSYEGGSNVVPAVVRMLRRKLGPYASSVETVRGAGYRYRRP